MTALHPPPTPSASDTATAVNRRMLREHSAARRRDALGVEVWRQAGMRAALAARDIGTVFRLVQRFGISQRRIAAWTGQSQSEISEIRGGRRVLSYEVLARVADGLGIPRGWMGLSYDDSTNWSRCSPRPAPERGTTTTPASWPPGSRLSGRHNPPLTGAAADRGPCEPALGRPGWDHARSPQARYV
jgi:hypothetical protein